VRTLSARVKAYYGAHPLHLITLLASFALVGYVISVMGTHQLWNSKVWWQSIVVWFFAAIVLHDLVLFPFYALTNRSLTAGWEAVRGRLPTPGPRVSPVNYVRLPAMASGLLFLMFFPGIIRQGKGAYLRATGLTQAPFLDRWLLITAVLFGSSAVAYAARSAWVGRMARQAGRGSSAEATGGEPS
jgi:TM2 domain-containing membrane protein YozV